VSKKPSDKGDMMEQWRAQTISCHRILNAAANSATTLTPTPTPKLPSPPSSSSSSSTSSYKCPVFYTTGVSSEIRVRIVGRRNKYIPAPTGRAHTNGTVIVPADKPNRLITGKINEASLMFEETQSIELSSDLRMRMYCTAFHSTGSQFATLDSRCSSFFISFICSCLMALLVFSGQISIYCEEHGIWRLSHSWICGDKTRLYPSVLCWNDQVLAMTFGHYHHDDENQNIIRLWRREGIEIPCAQVDMMIDDCVQGIT